LSGANGEPMAKVIRADDEFVTYMEYLRKQLAESLGREITVVDATKVLARMHTKQILIITRKASKRRKRNIIEDVSPYTVI